MRLNTRGAADAADEAYRETFEEIAAGVAHEIKNPLALAMANISLIRLGDAEQKFNKQCGAIETELSKVNAMVADLVNVVKDGVLDGREEVLSATETLAAVIDGFASCGGPTFVMEGFGAACPVLWNRRRLEMVFSNIIKNAVDAQGGTGEIRVKAENDDSRVRVIVEDCGGGLSSKDLANIGKGYYSAKPDGTGLGIAFCTNALARRGGELWMENRLGANGECVGCRVTLTLN